MGYLDTLREEAAPAQARPSEVLLIFDFEDVTMRITNLLKEGKEHESEAHHLLLDD